MSDYLPLMLNLADKEVVIFGGGSVAERKASLFCNYSNVTVISRDFTQGLDGLSKKRKINRNLLSLIMHIFLH